MSGHRVICYSNRWHRTVGCGQWLVTDWTTAGDLAPSRDRLDLSDMFAGQLGRSTQSVFFLCKSLMDVSFKTRHISFHASLAELSPGERIKHTLATINKLLRPFCCNWEDV